MKSNGFINNLATKMDKDAGSRKTGLVVSLIASVILFILNLPFASWLVLADPQSMVNSQQLKDEVIATLHMHYSILNIMDFVQRSKIGIIGLFSACLFALCVAADIFFIISAVKIIRNRITDKGLLGLIGTAKVGFILELLLTIGTMILPVFAKHNVHYDLFRPGYAPVVAGIIAVITYFLLKVFEAKEREKYREHGILKEFKKNWVLFLMLVPAFVYLIINNYLPMVGVYFAFTNFNFRDGLYASPYVGFKNFEFFLKADLWHLTKNTLLYNIVFIGLGNILQIFFAILISQVTVKWFKKSSQTLMFMPYFVSYVILKVLVYNLFEYNSGLINGLLTGTGGGKIDFYNTPSYWPYIITFFYMWKGIGYGMVVYLATITGIDTELYEAAKVDGANVFQQIRYITLPHIKPTFIILLLYALGSIMKGQFELFYQMVGNNGVLFGVTDILDTYVYRITTTQPLSIGTGTAAGLYQSLFGLAIVVITNEVVKRKNPDFALF
jgi:ABC-type polysaccharide transport system permease subunit